MDATTWKPLLDATTDAALDFLARLPERPVGPTATLQDLRDALGGPLPDGPQPPEEVVATLARAVDPGLMGTPASRFFGFVIGGALPATVAADWLTTVWDQNAGLYAAAPAAMVVEDVCTTWLADLLGLPADVSAGFVTGGQMANTTALVVARHAVLAAAGWDVEERGLVGAPGLTVVAGEERHATIDRALRFVGLGRGSLTPVAADEQGRMRVDALAEALAGVDGPTIVCAQVGNVNTGAVDPIGEIADLAHERGAWVHVDGAFGLWAAASSALRPLVAGVERADSWATDAHKWLNVPYDSGLAFTRHPQVHRRALGTSAAYLVSAEDSQRDAMDFNPEFSRRARGFPIYAALRSLGRAGVADLVDRCCALARRFAERLAAADGVEVRNEVVLNQVLVRFTSPGVDADRHTRDVIGRVQREGTCWLSGTTWHGEALMRVSVSNWSTTADDVDRAVAAILRCADQATAAHR